MRRAIVCLALLLAACGPFPTGAPAPASSKGGDDGGHGHERDGGAAPDGGGGDTGGPADGGGGAAPGGGGAAGAGGEVGDGPGGGMGGEGGVGAGGVGGVGGGDGGAGGGDGGAGGGDGGAGGAAGGAALAHGFWLDWAVPVESTGSGILRAELDADGGARLLGRTYGPSWIGGIAVPSEDSFAASLGEDGAPLWAVPAGFGQEYPQHLGLGSASGLAVSSRNSIVSFDANGSRAWRRDLSVDGEGPMLTATGDGAILAAAAGATWSAGSDEERTFPAQALSLARYERDGHLAWARVVATGVRNVQDLRARPDGTIRLVALLDAGSTLGEPASAIAAGEGLAVATYGADGVLVSGTVLPPDPSLPAWWGVLDVADDGGFVVGGAIPGGQTVTIGTGAAARQFTAGDGDWQDGFVAVFDASGGLRWARRLSGEGIEFATAGALLPGGDVVLAAMLEGTSADLELSDGSERTVYAPTSDSDCQLLLIRYDAFGELLATRVEGGDQRGRGQFAVSDVSANERELLVAGASFRHFVLGRGEPTEITLDSGDYRGIVARYRLHP